MHFYRKHSKHMAIFLLVCGLFVISIMSIWNCTRQKINKSIEKELAEIGKTYDLELEKCQILDKAETNDQTYILVNAVFDSGSNEEIALGLGGLYVYEIVRENGTVEAVEVYRAACSISSGFTANIVQTGDKQILFGDLRDSAYDGEKDEQVPVSYVTAEVRDDKNVIGSKKVKNKKGYIFLLPTGQDIEKIELLDNKGNVVGFASDGQDGGQSILNMDL